MDALYYQVDLLKTLNEKLTNSDRINQEFLNMSHNAYFYYNFSDDYFEATGDWIGLTGMKVNRLTDTELLYECVREDDESLVNEILNADVNGVGCVTKEFCLKNNKDWLEGSAYVKYGEDGESLEKFVCFRDITKFKLQNDELSYMAYYDSLTGLCNRNFFVKRLRDMIEQAEKKETTVAVAMIDIDDFKKINDSIGLILGDELIQDFGQFLGEFQDENTVVGRFGADVFILGIYDPYGTHSVENLYEHIQNRIKRPFVLSNKDEVYISVSTGIAEYPEAGDSGFVLIKNAEVCMFDAKNGNRGGIKYFDENILNKFLSTVSMEQRLRDAIGMESFILYYQPQFDTKTQKLRGAEALIRWQDTEGNFISPVEFIPLAEKSGGIIPIGNWVMREAVRACAGWQKQFDFNGIISINISAVQLRKENFVPNVMSILKRFDVDARHIELEITESVFIDDFEEISSKIRELRNYGMKVSLDDFGTGFSSLSYLKNLPIDTLKIDKTFMDTVISDESTGIITESVIAMVKKLGLETIAEGVEKPEQLEYLKRTGCDNIQGFLLGRPMAAEDFELLLMRE